MRPTDLADDAILNKVRAQHPTRDGPALPTKPSAPPLIISNAQALSALKKADNGSAPGPSGVSARVLRQLAEADIVTLDALTALFSAIANGSWDDTNGHAFATGGLTVLILKRAGAALQTQPDSAFDVPLLSALLGLNLGADIDPLIRSLTCGEAILKISGLLVLARMPKSNLAKFLEPFQLGVGVKGGVELAIMRLQRFLEEQGADPDAIVLFLDIADAFMRADRAKMLSAIYAAPELQPSWHLAHWHLGAPNPRYLPLGDGTVYAFHQSQGGPQGDPLMPLWFCVLMHVLLARILVNVSTAACILDDTAAGGHVSTISKLYTEAVRLAPELCGFEINPKKTIVLSASPAPSQAVVDFVGINGLQFAHGSAAYVGGIVGRNKSAMSAWVVEKARAHIPFFRVLVHPDMPPDYALRLLRQTLLPSFNLLLRAHSPLVSGDGARLLDEAIQHAYTAINLTPETLDQVNKLPYAEAQLPVRKGGDGMCSAEALAYPASFAAHAAALPDPLISDPLLPLPPLASFSTVAPPPADLTNAAATAATAAASAAAAEGDPGSTQVIRAAAKHAACLAKATLAALTVAATLNAAALAAAAPADDAIPAAPAAPAAAAAPAQTTLHEVYLQMVSFAVAHAPKINESPSLPATFTDFCKLYKTRTLDARHLQHVLCEIAHEETFARILAAHNSPADRARLLSLKHANPYPNMDLSDPALSKTPAQHRSIERTIRGLHPSFSISSNPAAACVCGAILALDKHHFTSCKQFAAQCKLSHDCGYAAIRRNMTECGIRSEKERRIGPGQDRTDIYCQLPQTGVPLHIDFTVANPAAASIATGPAKSDPYGAIIAREKTKRTRYSANAIAEGATFEPWVVTPFGAASATAHKLTKQFDEAAKLLRHPNAPSRKTMQDRVALEIFLGTAAINAAGLSRMQADHARPA